MSRAIFSATIRHWGWSVNEVEKNSRHIASPIESPDDLMQTAPAIFPAPARVVAAVGRILDNA